MILFFSDLHCHPFQQFAKLENGVNSRFLEILDVFDWLDKVCKRFKVTEIIFNGDITHTKSLLHTLYYGMLFERLAEFSKDKRVLAIPGNHDLGLLSAPEYTALKPLSSVIEVHEKQEIKQIRLKDIDLFMLPFIEDHAITKELIRSCQPSTRYSVFANHSGVDGFRLTGNEYEIKNPLTAKAIGVRKFNRVMLGHYHEHQIVDRVVSIGAPLQHNFNDETGRRGCVLLDPEKDEVFFIAYKAGPVFRTIEVLDEEDFSEIRKQGVSGQYVRCNLYTKKVSFESIRDYLESNAKNSVVNILTVDEFVIEELVQSATQTDDELADLLLKEMKVGDKVSHKVRRLALNYLQKADTNRLGC